MTPSVSSILAPLDPHWDRIIRRPLSRGDVDDLQRQVGLPVPAPLKDFLMAVGLFQDLTYWQASPFEVFDSPARMESSRQFLCDVLPPKHHDLFPFGDDGAGNVFCLPTGRDVPCRLHFVDHQTRKV